MVAASETTITETEMTITVVIEIGLSSDFPGPDSLEAEEFNEIIEEIFTEGKIQEVVTCIRDLIDNVEKAVISPQIKITFQKKSHQQT